MVTRDSQNEWCGTNRMPPPSTQYIYCKILILFDIGIVKQIKVK